MDKNTTKEVIYRNLVAEKAVIGWGLRVDPKILFNLKKDYFTVYPYRVFYEIVLDKKHPLTREALTAILKVEYPSEKKQFKGALDKIFGGFDPDTQTPDTIHDLTETLTKLYEIRRIVDGVDKVIDMVGDDREFDLDEAVSILKSATKIEIRDDDSGDYLEDFDERKKIVNDRRELGQERNSVGVPTGIESLDHLTGGAMPDELILVGGKTSVGKSIFSHNVGASAWLAGYNVIIFSLEMQKKQVQFRIDSLLSAIPYINFRLGTIDDDRLDQWEKRIVGYKEMLDNYLEVVYLSKDQTVEAIEAKTYEIQDRRDKRVDLIIIDYMNLLRPKTLKSGVSAKEATLQADISWALRLLSGNLNGVGVPIISPVQLTDKADHADHLQTEHIKYSRGISENASVIYGLKQTPEDAIDGVMQLQCIKSRDGKKFKPIILRPNFDIMLIHNEQLSDNGQTDINQMTRG